MSVNYIDRTIQEINNPDSVIPELKDKDRVKVAIIIRENNDWIEKEFERIKEQITNEETSASTAIYSAIEKFWNDPKINEIYKEVLKLEDEVYEKFLFRDLH